MADEIENMTLRLLRRMDEKLDSVVSRLDSMDTHLQAIDLRLQSVDVSIGGLRAEQAEHGKRLDRIERRLDLADA
jgi:division protein CdvB (Snf7/Vps24/ESCRT-III family)